LYVANFLLKLVRPVERGMSQATPRKAGAMVEANSWII